MKLQEKLQFFLQKWINKGSSRPMTPKEKWMLLLLAGMLMAVIIFPMDKEKDNTDIEFPLESITDNSSIFNAAESSTDDLNQYACYLSERLEIILSQIDGAGAVEAWVTLSGSGEVVLYEEKDDEQSSLEEADSVGGTRKEKNCKSDRAVLTDKDGNPYVVKTLQPEVEGVLVVAEGAGDSTVKKNISEAVQVLFDIEAHRIKVAKKKVEE